MPPTEPATLPECPHSSKDGTDRRERAARATRLTPRALAAAEAALPPFDDDCSPYHEQGPVAVSYFDGDIGVAGTLRSPL